MDDLRPFIDALLAKKKIVKGRFTQLIFIGGAGGVVFIACGREQGREISYNQKIETCVTSKN